MKKMFIWMSAIVLGIVLLTGCEKETAMKKTLKYLPGTWRISGYLDDGLVEDIRDNIVMTFGTEDRTGSDSYSGSYSLKVNGYKAISNGRWHAEPAEYKDGVYLYITDEDGDMYHIVGGEGSIVYISKITSSYMEVLFDEDSDEGYAFEKVD